eukprot:6190872-Pleurochrysis_carterae.AAC.2
MAGEYDGEVLGSAAELRAMFKVPAEQQHQLSDGVCFARWIGSGSGLPVILLGGGTGCALFYKAFAEKLSAQYNGPVLIWDRFNIGFSDRVPNNGLVLWTRQMLELMDILAIKKAHLACFSLASISGAYFAVEHPSRVARIALVSPILGGVRQDTQLSKQIQKMVKVPSCLRGCLGEIIFKRKLVPRLYQRCEGQVKEGGDPDGLPVAKQMYRVRGTARSFVEYMLLDETFITYQTKGLEPLLASIDSRILKKALDGAGK